jgi:peptide deformylase
MDHEYNIITDDAGLKKPCKKVSEEDAKKISKILLKELDKTSSGVGLAANQIGIDAAVCIIRVDKPIVLVNPVIENSFKKIFFQEACLSFPNQPVITQRYANITVKADNHNSTLYFGEKNILECVCVQHEIDHLNGITIFDRQIELDNESIIEYSKSTNINCL